MLAKLEQDTVNVYDEHNKLIGGIKMQSKDKTADITIGENLYQLKRDKSRVTLLENGDVKLNLKSSSFSGNTEIIENGKKITGVFGLKWGTKLVDRNQNTLIKIRNENQFVNTNSYIIQVSDSQVTDLDILTTLYGHLYGSNMKTQAAIFGAVAVVGVMIWFTS